MDVKTKAELGEKLCRELFQLCCESELSFPDKIVALGQTAIDMIAGISETKEQFEAICSIYVRTFSETVKGINFDNEYKKLN